MENGREAQVSNFSLELSEQEAPVRGIPATLSPPPSLAVSLLINGVGWGRKRRTIINIDGSADLFLIMCFASVLIGMETVTWLERPGASWGLSFFLSLPLFSFLFGWSLTWWEWRGQWVRNIKPNLRGCSQAGELRGVTYWGVHGMWGQGGLDWKVGRKCLQDRESSCPEELRPSKGRKGQQLSWFSLMMRNMVAFLGETRKAQGQEEHPKSQLIASPYPAV